MNLRTLEFVVNGLRISKKEDCDFSHIVAGSRGDLQMRFYFSEDWTGYVKVASFWFKDKVISVALDENDICRIPNAAADGEMFEVSVAAAKGKMRVHTNKVEVKQEVLW